MNEPASSEPATPANQVQSTQPTVAGGGFNLASRFASTIGRGRYDSATHRYAVVSGERGTWRRGIDPRSREGLAARDAEIAALRAEVDALRGRVEAAQLR